LLLAFFLVVALSSGWMLRRFEGTQCLHLQETEHGLGRSCNSLEGQNVSALWQSLPVLPYNSTFTTSQILRYPPEIYSVSLKMEALNSFETSEHPLRGHNKHLGVSKCCHSIYAGQQTMYAVTSQYFGRATSRREWPSTQIGIIRSLAAVTSFLSQCAVCWRNNWTNTPAVKVQGTGLPWRAVRLWAADSCLAALWHLVSHTATETICRDRPCLQKFDFRTCKRKVFTVHAVKEWGEWRYSTTH
jgi:hypothetical protein